MQYNAFSKLLLFLTMMLQILSIPVRNDPEMSLTLALGCQDWVCWVPEGAWPLQQALPGSALPALVWERQLRAFGICPVRSLTRARKLSIGGYCLLVSSYGVLQRAKVWGF